MRNVICLLILFSTIYTSKQDVIEPLGYLERLVNVQKRFTEAVLNDVLFFKKRIKQNLEVRLNDLKIQALFKVNNIINSTFENINLSIENGKKKGKKIDECYDYAKHNLETKKDNTIIELEMSIQNGNTTMETPLTNLAKNIKAIRTVLTDLNFIIPNCYSSNFIKMQHCVMTNLSLISSSLKNIKNNVINLMNIAITVRMNMIKDVTSVMMKLVVDIRIFSTDIIIRINSCVRNASADNAKSTNIPNSLPSINSFLSRNF
ncbi:uncharacterized protein [Anoplolepis gracilipes]|uniref:uncharacterized protein n=1 Tax=Anoplolepis gracilipes TaxID=354296 RepID=UPI003B9E1093